MTPRLRALGIGLSVIAASATGAAGLQPAPTVSGKVGNGATSVKPSPAASAQIAAPKFLAERVDALGKAFDGKVGISVRSIDDRWATGWREKDLYPQQSVSKLWVAITALDAADRGKVDMNEKVRLSRSDLTLFHQPIAAKILGGGYTTTLDDLMIKAITTSDNTANDKLMRAVGGPKAVRSTIATKGLGAIRFYDGERALQSRIAGLIWSPKYSIGSAFWDARRALPLSARRAAFERYVADPYDGASPAAMTDALARLKRGELLSAKSTRHLLAVMGKTRTGANRLKGGLKPGWTLSHKTGTGQELGSQQAGYNDVGILTAPDGRSYAVAVMIKLTSVPLPTRMKLMNRVVEATIAQHEMLYATAAVRRQ